MDEKKDSDKKISVDKVGSTKLSPYVEKTSLIPEDFDDDIAIVGENVKANPLIRKKKFLKRKPTPVIQILDESSDEEYANVCGFNVNIKLLLENEEIRKQLEPFIEMETVYPDSSESEYEDFIVSIDEGSAASSKSKEKQLKVCKSTENISNSNQSGKISVITYRRDVIFITTGRKVKIPVSDSTGKLTFRLEAEKSNAKISINNTVEDVEILSLSDSSDDEKILKKKKIDVTKEKINSKKILESTKLVPSPKIKNVRSLPRISHIIKYDAPFNVSLLKRREPEKKEEYMKNLELEPLNETLQTESDIVLDDLINMDLSSDAKILSVVDKLCEPDEVQNASDNVNSTIEENSSVLESSDYDYLSIPAKIDASTDKNVSPVKKYEDEISSKDKINKLEEEIISPKKNNNFYKIKSPSLGEQIKLESESLLIENIKPETKTLLASKKIEDKKDNTTYKNNTEYIKDTSPLKTNTESNHSTDNQILKITDDILPVETVAPKRRGRKRKRGKKIATFGKIGLQKKISKKNSKNLDSVLGKPSINDLIQDTLSETIKSFYSTDQLAPIKQEIQDVEEEIISEEPTENLKMDTIETEKEIAINNKPSETLLLDTNNLLSVYRTESVQEFYKSKSQQKKRRKKRKRVTRMKYENIDRTQWIFLPRQKRGEKQLEGRYIMGECKKCGKQYERMSCLRMHEPSCSGMKLETKRECAICGLRAKNRAEFKAHLLTHILQAPPSSQNIADKELPLSQHEFLEETSNDVRNRRNMRKIGKTKLKFLNRKKMERKRIGLRSSNAQSPEFQTDMSAETDYLSPNLQFSESVSPRNRLVIRRGRRVYKQQRMYKSKNYQFIEQQLDSTTNPIAYQNLETSTHVYNSADSPIKKMKYKIRHRRISRFYKKCQKTSNPPRRVGVLAYCMAHCRRCERDTYAERRRLYCQLCSCTLEYWCGMCKKQFFTFGAVRCHLIKGLEDKISPEVRCPKCYRAHFSTRCSFRRHKRNCNVPYRFDKKCVVRLENCEFQPHLFKGHPGVQHVHCENCHIRKVVFKEQTNCNICQLPLQYICEICDKLLESDSNLRKHILNDHIMGTVSHNSNDKVGENYECEEDEEYLQRENSDSDSNTPELLLETKHDFDERSDDYSSCVNKNIGDSEITSTIKDLCNQTSNLSLSGLNLLKNYEVKNLSNPEDQSLQNISSSEKVSKPYSAEGYPSVINDGDDDSMESNELATEIQISSKEIFEIIGVNSAYLVENDHAQDSEISLTKTSEDPILIYKMAEKPADHLTEKNEVNPFSEELSLEGDSLAETNSVYSTVSTESQCRLVVRKKRFKKKTRFTNRKNKSVKKSLQLTSLENDELLKDLPNIDLIADDSLVENNEDTVQTACSKTSENPILIHDETTKPADNLNEKNEVNPFSEELPELSLMKSKQSTITSTLNNLILNVNVGSESISSVPQTLEDSLSVTKSVHSTVSTDNQQRLVVRKKRFKKKIRFINRKNKSVKKSLQLTSLENDELLKDLPKRDLIADDSLVENNQDTVQTPSSKIISKIKMVSNSRAGKKDVKKKVLKKDSLSKSLSVSKARLDPIGENYHRLEESNQYAETTLESLIGSLRKNLGKNDAFSKDENRSSKIIPCSKSVHPSSVKEFKISSRNIDLDNELTSFSMELVEDSLIENEQPIISLTVDNLIKKMDESSEVIQCTSLEPSKNCLVEVDQSIEIDNQIKIIHNCTESNRSTDAVRLYYESDTESSLNDNVNANTTVKTDYHEQEDNFKQLTNLESKFQDSSYDAEQFNMSENVTDSAKSTTSIVPFKNW